MAARVLRCDFETRSAVELRDAGVHAYAAHATTDAWCMGYAFGDGPVDLWRRGEPCPPAIAEHVRAGGEIRAFNAAFERIIWRDIMGPRYGWPVPRIDQWRCTMVQGMAMALPGSLEQMGLALGLDTQKDMAGKRLSLQMAKPRKVDIVERTPRVLNRKMDGQPANAVYIGRPSKWGNPFEIGTHGTRAQVIAQYEAYLRADPQLMAALPELRGRDLLCWCHPEACHGDVLLRLANEAIIAWWDTPDRLERLYAYCRQDVEVERQVDARTMRLPPAEQALWVLDQEINDRGVFVDLRLCHAARAVVAKATEALDDEMRAVTRGAVGRVTNTAELKAWIAGAGVDVESVAKDQLADLLLRDDLPPDVRRALEIRQEGGKTSVKKVDALLRGTQPDGRARGLLQFHAANTGRWGGRRFQPQNLPRPALVKSVTEKDADEAAVQRIAIDAIHRGDLREVEMLFGAPLTVVSDVIRGMIAAPKGRAIISGDFAAIEGRGVAWLAGQQDVLDVFASGKDVYIQQASGIFGVPPERVGKGPKRQIGKVSILALGFGGGVGAYLAMARTYMLKIGDHYDEIWGVAQAEHREKAREAWSDRGKRSGVAERTWLAAEVVKVAWRAANPKIVQSWRDLEDAAIDAVRNPGRTFGAGYVRFKKAGSFLWCQLPSGRCLCYPYPVVVTVKTPWGTERPQLRYRYVDQFTKKWVEGPTYGGSLAENATQAVARDLMADAMLRATAAGYALVLTVHDELVSEDPADFGSAEEFKRLMEVAPDWAPGFPIAASVWRGARYRK